MSLTEEEKKQIVDYRLEKSKRTLEDAKKVIELKMWATKEIKDFGRVEPTKLSEPQSFAMPNKGQGAKDERRKAGGSRLNGSPAHCSSAHSSFFLMVKISPNRVMALM